MDTSGNWPCRSRDGAPATYHQTHMSFGNGGYRPRAAIRGIELATEVWNRSFKWQLSPASFGSYRLVVRLAVGPRHGHAFLANQLRGFWLFFYLQGLLRKSSTGVP